MFLRSKVQETILKGRSTRSMNGASAQQRSHVSDQLASPSSTVSCDNAVSASGAGGKSATARALFAPPPRLSHSSSLPTGGSVFGKSPAPDADSFSMSPTSVLDAAAPFADVVVRKRRPWREGLHGLADALDGQQQQRERSVLAATSRSSLLVRSCSLDRRVVEFGVKSKGSWLPLRKAAAAALSSEPGGDAEVTMEPSSEDYTCVICRGPNPRTVHIFGDRVVEDGAESELAVAASARSTRHGSARRGGGLLEVAIVGRCARGLA